MDQKILVWNCQGARSKKFMRQLRMIGNDKNPDIVGLLWTRVEGVRAADVFRSLGSRDSLIVPGSGFSGGIWITWRSERVSVSCVKQNSQFEHLSVKYCNEESWKLTVAYVCPRESEKRMFWEEMKELAAELYEPWALIGDFNDIRMENEKTGGAPVNMRKCNLFDDRISNCGLLEIGAWGNHFTWKGPLIPGYERVFERHDRGLCNDILRCHFQEAIIKNLVQLDYSDHCPMLLCLKEVPSGYRA